MQDSKASAPKEQLHVSVNYLVLKGSLHVSYFLAVSEGSDSVLVFICRHLSLLSSLSLPLPLGLYLFPFSSAALRCAAASPLSLPYA